MENNKKKFKKYPYRNHLFFDYGKAFTSIYSTWRISNMPII